MKEFLKNIIINYFDNIMQLFKNKYELIKLRKRMTIFTQNFDEGQDSPIFTNGIFYNHIIKTK
ncbi:MAG: hypothetical protein RSB95_04835 [Bacilli bacterium]